MDARSQSRRGESAARPYADAGELAELQLDERLLVIYDGLCGLCNASIRWLIRRDRRDRLRFAPSSDPRLAALLAAHPISSGVSGVPESILVVCALPAGNSPEILVRSRAVLAAFRVLPPPWPAVAALGRLVPVSLADAVYRLAARWRYRVWGRLSSCPLPAPSERGHFL